MEHRQCLKVFGMARLKMSKCDFPGEVWVCWFWNVHFTEKDLLSCKIAQLLAQTKNFLSSCGSCRNLPIKPALCYKDVANYFPTDSYLPRISNKMPLTPQNGQCQKTKQMSKTPQWLLCRTFMHVPISLKRDYNACNDRCKSSLLYRIFRSEGNFLV